MFHKILVPLDQSSQAERAIPFAAQLARMGHGEIVLTHVLGVPLEYATPVIPPYMPPVYDTMCAEAEGYLQRICGLPVLTGLSVTTEVTVGPAAETILDTAIEQDVDAIVMTTHGRTGISRLALGSVARHLVRYAHVPVLALRSHGPAETDAVKQPAYRALVPLDGSPLAEEAIASAARVAVAFATSARPAALTLAMVVDPSYVSTEFMPESLLRNGAVQYLEHIAERVERSFTFVKVSWVVLAERDIAASLVRLAEQGVASGALAGTPAPGRCDLIAMTTHGRTGIARLALGSITEHVLEMTKLPLLVMRASGIEGLERNAAVEPIRATSNPSPSEP